MLSAVFLFGSLCSAQTTLRGRVVDQGGAAVRGATVRVEAGDGAKIACASTDVGGAFSFEAAPQQYRVSVYLSPEVFLPYSVERVFTPLAVEDFTPQVQTLMSGPGGPGRYLQIRDAQDCPLADANVGVRPFMGHGPELTGRTKEDGYFFINPFVEAPFSVSIAAPGYKRITDRDIDFGNSSVQVIAMAKAASPQEENPHSDGPLLESAALPAIPADSTKTWEYGVQASGGVGLEDRTNYSFLNAGAHAGRVLTSNFGSGLLQENFEYGVEVIPFWQSYTPKFQRLNCPAGATSASQCHGPTTTGGTYRGVSIVPIQLRLNFTHSERIMPWIQGAGGVLYTSRKYPGVGNLNVADPTQTGPAADTSVWNFTPQGGVGMHYFVKPRRSLDVSANAVHISSASLGDKNPGVNVSLQFAVGYSWWK